MESVVEEIFRGEYAPGDSIGIRDEKRHALSERICALQDELCATLSDEARARYEEIDGLLLDAGFRDTMLAYMEGFRFGVRIMLEALGV